ncbi:hypothetical protein Aspvir_002880 [Aspergillus viridinutans]|uniref:Uncharacterized protein n=1 Tax=Aspergillus viridinutans TaxID=75553 RepID=A0A9P3C345_ASPVI|nr:uncharacterized protein Aspvir_002880 [Aspergillus viridinutans]GIK07223.1 hypothetical protein Aspvir_002880 [Aspergillus viridinutans]
MPRTVYLAVLGNVARPAHFAIFIPTGNAGLIGKLIHVTGNPAQGFFLQFKRNYNFEETKRKHQIIPLAQVDDRYIKDTPGDESLDTTARDWLESVATVVPPPGPSPNPFDPSARNCQDWMQDYVEKLIEEGFLPSSAALVVQNAPKMLQ